MRFRCPLRHGDQGIEAQLRSVQLKCGEKASLINGYDQRRRCCSAQQEENTKLRVICQRKLLPWRDNNARYPEAETAQPKASTITCNTIR